MKRNPVTIIVGAILIVIFIFLLFTFQVRQTQIAVVTTFGKPGRQVEEPGLKWKWPFPVQKVYKFDQRIHSYEGKFEQVFTSDEYNLVVMPYIGWTIRNPARFFNSFPSGVASAAEPALESLLRSATKSVVGRHPFSNFVSTDPEELQFAEIEEEILQAVQSVAQENYGIAIELLGIKKLGLPESVTQKVFDRMRAERQSEVDRLQAQGEARAMEIRSAADTERQEILAEAEAQATAIRGEADAQAAEYYAVFEQNPELAIFLRKLRALESTLKERATLILDEDTPPFDLLRQSARPDAAAITDSRPAPPPRASEQETTQQQRTPLTAIGSANADEESSDSSPNPPATDETSSGSTETEGSSND